MSELKPCPFCGGEASLFHDDKERGTTRVGCYRVCFVRPRVLVRGVTHEDADPEAIDRWNRRSDPNA